LPEKYFESAREKLLWKIALLDLLHPIFEVFFDENPGFRALHVDGEKICFLV